MIIMLSCAMCDRKYELDTDDYEDPETAALVCHTSEGVCCDLTPGLRTALRHPELIQEMNGNATP